MITDQVAALQTALFSPLSRDGADAETQFRAAVSIMAGVPMKDTEDTILFLAGTPNDADPNPSFNKHAVRLRQRFWLLAAQIAHPALKVPPKLLPPTDDLWEIAIKALRDQANLVANFVPLIDVGIGGPGGQCDPHGGAAPGSHGTATPLFARKRIRPPMKLGH